MNAFHTPNKDKCQDNLFKANTILLRTKYGEKTTISYRQESGPGDRCFILGMMKQWDELREMKTIKK